MYWIWTLFYVIFHLHAGKTEIPMKYSNIVRKQARRRWWNKAGCWRVKILVNSLSCESLSWRDAVCWQITQHLFVSDWQWPCVEQRDAGHTRIKNELDKIGIKKQEVEQSMLTFSSLMLKPNRIRTFDAMTWTPEHIHLTKWKTPASSKSATVRPGLRTCQSSYCPSRRSLPGCVRESRRERSKGKNGGFKNYYSPTDRQGYQWSRDKVNIMQYERN